MKRILMLIALCLIAGIDVAVSQAVGIGNTSFVPDLKSILEIRSTNTGILIPRMTAAQRIAIAPAVGAQLGLLVYQTDAPVGYWYWNGTIWVRVMSGNEGWAITGNAGTISGTNFVGTTDAQALDFRTNNFIRFRIPNANQVHAMSLGTAALPFYSFSADPNTGIFSSAADALDFSTNGLARFRVPNAYQVHGLSLGTAALPFYSFSADPNTGMYSSSADYLNLSTAGSARVTVDNNGSLGIGTLTPYTSTIGGANVQRLNVISSATPANAAMAEFVNSSSNGLALAGFNTSTTNAFSSIEAGANGPGVAIKGIHKPSIPIGSLGFGIGVEGSSNSYDGFGVSGVSPADVSFGDPGAAGFFNWDVVCGDLWSWSDSRLKLNFNEYTGALGEIMKIKVYTFNYNQEILTNANSRNRYGFIAQELETIFPTLVKEKRILNNKNQASFSEYSQKEDIYKVVNYVEIVPILTRAVQEQQAIIIELSRRILELEKQNSQD